MGRSPRAGISVAGLAVRPLSPADEADVRAMHADPATMASIGGVRDDRRTRDYMERNLAHWDEHGVGLYALRDARTGRFLGRAGLRWTTLLGARELELGYALCREAWGRGLATAVAGELVTLAAEASLAPTLVAFTQPSNRASRRVMDKVGLRFEREFERDGAPLVLYRRALGGVAPGQ